MEGGRQQGHGWQGVDVERGCAQTDHTELARADEPIVPCPLYPCSCSTGAGVRKARSWIKVGQRARMRFFRLGPEEPQFCLSCDTCERVTCCFTGEDQTGRSNRILTSLRNQNERKIFARRPLCRCPARPTPVTKHGQQRGAAVAVLSTVSNDAPE